MFKWKEIELEFKTNPNKSRCLVCIWVITHIRMVFEVIHDRSLNKDMKLKDKLNRKEIPRRIGNGLMCV